MFFDSESLDKQIPLHLVDPDYPNLISKWSKLFWPVQNTARWAGLDGVENKTYARESALYKARDRQRIGQKRKVRHRRPDNLRNSQKGLITARAQSYGKSVCKKTKKKKYAVLRFFAHAAVATR